jgi:general secretion pathway protein D
MKIGKQLLIFVLFGLLMQNIALAKSDCDDKVFSNLSSAKGTTISQMLEQLSSRCSFSITVKDDNAEAMLEKPLNTVNLRDFALKDVFDFLLIDNKLDYDYQNGMLKISSYTSKTFKVDYITAVRSAETTFSMGGGAASSSSSAQTAGQQASTSIGSVFKADDSNSKFWASIEKDLSSILNPEFAAVEKATEVKSEAQNKGGVLDGRESTYTQKRSESLHLKSNSLIINSQAGLITITATKAKLQEAEKYIETVLERLHKQVFIDVQIYSVTLNKTNTTGIDWSKLYGALALKASYGSAAFNGTSTIDTSTGVITTAGAGPVGLAQYFRVNGAVDLTDFVKFLRTQGDVKTVSNPKIMTLNNQPALITSGDVIFYPKVTGGTSATATTGATNPTVETVPLNVGVTLDITPEIMDDMNILLKINPTSSSCISTNCPLQTVQVAGVAYNIAPNIAQKQLSSVVKAGDGERIILGGLIKDSTGTDTKKVPFLGDIPVLGYLFKQDIDTKVMEEMVIVITPHIIKKDKPLSLKELGYKSDLDK